MRTGSLFVLGALVALLGACDRRLEPYVPAEEEPPPSEQPLRMPGLEQPEARSGARQLAPTPGGVVSPIRGTVRLAEGVPPPDGGVLFVIARSAAGPGGAPIAVKRLTVGSFPVEFQIGQEEVMLPGRFFLGGMLLSARVDADGDPLTRDDGELVAENAQMLLPGATGVDLVLQPPPKS